MTKVASRLCIDDPAVCLFCLFITFRFQDKRVFAFKAEIQDGCQKWRENDFGKSRQ